MVKIKRFAAVVSLLLAVLASSPSAQTFEASMNAGSNSLERGDFNQAVTHFRAAAQRDPRSFAAQYNLAIALLNLGRHSNAEAEFKKALGLNPDNSHAWLNLSVALQSQGKTGEALEALSRAVKADPNNIAARMNLAASYAGGGRLPQAIAEYKSMIDEGHRMPEVYMNYAKALISANRIDEAKQLLQSAIENDPNLVEARWELADLYKKFDKDLNRAAQELRLAIAAKADEPKLYEALADILEAQDKRNEAAEQLRRAMIYTDDSLEKGRLQRRIDTLQGRTSVTGPGTASPAPTPGSMQTLKREETQPAKRTTTTPGKTVNVNFDDLLKEEEPSGKSPFDDIQKKGR